MWIIRATTKKPFWTNNNENVPSLQIFNNFLNTEMLEIEKFNINYLNNLSGQIVSDYEYQYFEIKNNDKVYYYYVNSIDKILKDNKTNKPLYVLNITIDIYCSYTIKFIYDNLDKELLFLRTHEYDKKCLQINDKFLDNIPKIYNKYYFKKLPFNYDEIKKIWYGNSLGLKDNGDLVNANRYYVFKDGPGGGYTFLPICSKTKDITLYYEERFIESKAFEGTFWNGRSNGSLRQEITDDVNNAIVNAYKNNQLVQYYYREVDYGYRFPAHTVWLTDWILLQGTPYGTLPIDIIADNKSDYSAGIGLKYIDFNIYLLGNQIYHAHYTNITSSKFGDIDNVRNNGRLFKVSIYDTKVDTRTKIIKNSITGLEAYRKKEENINKFLGIFYLPHFLNFDTKRLNFNGDYASFTISPQQDNINFFKIFNYELSNITEQINNNSYSTEYLLKYLNIKYYGNPINAEYRTNDQHIIYLGGKLFFTDCATIISKSSELLSLDKAIITYPYQLPIGVDTYEQYVKANRNVTETGFNIERQKQQLNFAKGIANSTLNYWGAVGQATSGVLSGNVGEMARAGTQIAQNTSDTIFNNISLFKGLEYTSKKITAQYQQINNTSGNEIHFSTISTASLLEYYNDNTGEQYEGVEISELDENILILINNFILLNGYFLTNKSTFNKKINNERLFNYIILDSLLLDNLVNLNYNNKIFNNNIYEMIKTQLTNGLRIWNKIGDIPEYDNQIWPDQPSDTRPQLPPQQPPQIPTEPDPETPTNSKELTLEPNWHYTNLTYDYDNGGIKVWGEKTIFYCGFYDTAFICILSCYHDDYDFTCGETAIDNSGFLYNWDYEGDLKGYESVTINCKNLKLENICANYENGKLYFLQYANTYNRPLYITNLDENIKKYFEDNNAFIKILEGTTIINLYINGVKYER